MLPIAAYLLHAGEREVRPGDLEVPAGLVEENERRPGVAFNMFAVAE